MWGLGFASCNSYHQSKDAMPAATCNLLVGVVTFLVYLLWLFNRAVGSMVYYGIFLGAPSLGGNMYLNFFITTMCEAVAMAIGAFALDK